MAGEWSVLSKIHVLNGTYATIKNNPSSILRAFSIFCEVKKNKKHFKLFDVLCFCESIMNT